MPRYFSIMQKYLTAKEAAEYLRRSIKSLERWRAENDGPPYKKIKGRVLYPYVELEEWANRH